MDFCPLHRLREAIVLIWTNLLIGADFLNARFSVVGFSATGSLNRYMGQPREERRLEKALTTTRNSRNGLLMSLLIMPKRKQRGEKKFGKNVLHTLRSTMCHRTLTHSLKVLSSQKEGVERGTNRFISTSYTIANVFMNRSGPLCTLHLMLSISNKFCMGRGGKVWSRRGRSEGAELEGENK